MVKLKETDIESFIENSVQENLNLDYKSSPSLENTPANKKEISKDVSAFANSNGGRIIYGIVEKNHLPEKIDDGIDPNGKREWLEQVINSNIKPRIPNVIITPIELEKPSNKTIFDVKIPVGITAHQASDFRYYRRFNFQSVPMYDYEVKMVINRFKEPKIELIFSLSSDRIGEYNLEIIAINRGLVSTPSAHIKLFIPDYIFDGVKGDNWYFGEDTVKYGEDYVRILNYNWPKDSDLELFPELKLILSSKRIADTILLSSRNVKLNQKYSGSIFYEIYARNAQPIKGKTSFKIIGFTHQIILD